MRVRDVVDEEGQARSFQVSNTFVSRTDIGAIIATMPGARILQRAQGVWLDDACRFLVGSVEFQAWEPYGDSDCYWIGATLADVPPELQQVRERFQRYNPILGHHYAREVAALALTLACSLLLWDLVGRIPASARVALMGFAVLGCGALVRARRVRAHVRARWTSLSARLENNEMHLTSGHCNGRPPACR